ncbi:MAG: dTDP-4-amino-4,6-dideoxygalactose transaminase [Planctomycetota bacterium]|jgi:dTDP-4-amino-4,6-dideoxygalactose transaminase
MSDPVPFIDLKAQYQTIKDDLLPAVEAVLESQQFILGDTVAQFENELSGWMGLESGGVVGVSSGTDALLAALMALGVGPGDEVLTTPFSFFATAGVIARLHAKPVFVDIDPVTFNLDAGRLQALDASRFKAIIVVHLYGRCADIEAVREWADPHGVPVIEDAAQAIGTRDKNDNHCGSLGTVGCFSFFPTKNLGAAGDGGCLVTTDPKMLEDLRRIRVHGAVTAYESQVIGGNFRLDAIQAAILKVKLKHLDSWTERRLENAEYYDRRFREEGMAEELALPPLPGNREFVAHQYVIRSKKRDALREDMAAGGVASAIYYPMPFHLMPSFANLNYTTGDYPETERACAEVLALPIFAELGEERMERVVESVLSFYHS